MDRNRQTLDLLFETRQIQVGRGLIFDLPPSPPPATLDWGHVEGMMLGLAVGDALGCTSESQTPGERQRQHGEIRDYLPNRHADYKPIGLPSDDTQLAFWTLEQMIADREFNPEHVAARFCQGRIFGLGSTVRRFVNNHQSAIRPWYRCGVKSAGNGALMRMAPMVIPHLRSGTSDLWIDTALSAMITHNDSASIAACLSFVNMLWKLLQMQAPPEPSWWLETYVEVARDLEIDDAYRPRGGDFCEYQGMVWRFVEDRVDEAYRRGLSVREACDSWYSGAFLLETVPSVLYILMRHGDDLEEAIIRAVNDTKDNDTIAAIVGAAVGALHGRPHVPERWIASLAGRTTDRDDGRIFALLQEARSLWGHLDDRGQERFIGELRD
jgi:ADP-ribosyl-[dinitrogen reductase] hydrolase